MSISTIRGARAQQEFSPKVDRQEPPIPFAAPRSQLGKGVALQPRQPSRPQALVSRSAAVRLAQAVPAAISSPTGEGEELEALGAFAKNCLLLASQVSGDSPEGQSLQVELRDFAASAFVSLSEAAAASSHEEIRYRAPLYDGYHFLVQGDLEPAQRAFEKIQGEFPEAKAIVEEMGRQQKLGFQFAILAAWESYAEEGEASQLDQANGFLFRGLGYLKEQWKGEGYDYLEEIRGRWDLDRQLVKQVRAKLQAGQASNIQEALAWLTQAGPESLRARAHSLLEPGDRRDHAGSDILASLMEYSSAPGDAELSRRLFEGAQDLNLRYGAQKTPFAIYSILQAAAPGAELREAAQNAVKELIEGKDSLKILGDLVRSIGTDDLSELAMMAGASKLGALAKLGTLNRLQSAGMTGARAMALAFGAETGTEAMALWGLKTLKESALHDTAKTLSAEHLSKSLALNLIMVGGLKAGGLLGRQGGPLAARSLGLVGEGGRLSAGGRALAWGLNHGAGFGGMAATGQINQGLGLAVTPQGGLRESLLRDFFGYVKYGIAQRGFDHSLGEGYARFCRELHGEIAIREAELKADQALGRILKIGRDAEGRRVFPDRSSAALHRSLVEASLGAPGFDGEKWTKLLQLGRRREAAAYLDGFGLEASFDGKLPRSVEAKAQRAWAVDRPASPSIGPRLRALIDEAKALATKIALSHAMLIMGGMVGDFGGGQRGANVSFENFCGWRQVPLRKEVNEAILKADRMVQEAVQKPWEHQDGLQGMLAFLNAAVTDSQHYVPTERKAIALFLYQTAANTGHGLRWIAKDGAVTSMVSRIALSGGDLVEYLRNTILIDTRKADGVVAGSKELDLLHDLIATSKVNYTARAHEALWDLGDASDPTMDRRELRARIEAKLAENSYQNFDDWRGKAAGTRIEHFLRHAAATVEENSASAESIQAQLGFLSGMLKHAETLTARERQAVALFLHQTAANTGHGVQFVTEGTTADALIDAALSSDAKQTAFFYRNRILIKERFQPGSAADSKEMQKLLELSSLPHTTQTAFEVLRDLSENPALKLDQTEIRAKIHRYFRDWKKFENSTDHPVDPGSVSIGSLVGRAVLESQRRDKKQYRFVTDRLIDLALRNPLPAVRSEASRALIFLAGEIGHSFASSDFNHPQILANAQRTASQPSGPRNAHKMAPGRPLISWARAHTSSRLQGIDPDRHIPELGFFLFPIGDWRISPQSKGAEAPPLWQDIVLFNKNLVLAHARRGDDAQASEPLDRVLFSLAMGNFEDQPFIAKVLHGLHAKPFLSPQLRSRVEAVMNNPEYSELFETYSENTEK